MIVDSSANRSSGLPRAPPGRPSNLASSSPSGWIAMPPMNSVQTACVNAPPLATVPAAAQTAADTSIPGAPPK